MQSLEVTGLQDDGDGKYTVTAVNGDDTPYIEASFALAKFSVKASAVSGGTISVPSGVFAAGEKVEVSFTADEGYILKNASYTCSGKMYDLAVSDGKSYIVMPGADVTVNAEFATEDSEDIVKISKPQELITLAENVKAGNTYEGKTVILQSDLDMAGTEFIPIGYDNEVRDTASQIKCPFKGTFDGNGHTVNINMNSPYNGHQGLFGYVENGTVKNVTVTGRVNAGGDTKANCVSAGVVAYISNGTVLNCINDADVSIVNGGGVVGNAANSCISDCVNNGSISGNGECNVGGIVCSADTSKLIRCINNGYVWQQNEVAGGIAAISMYGTEITECINSGTVVSNNKIAGIVARAHGGATISDCYNIGTIRQNNRNAGGQGVGGIVAYGENGIAKLSNVYNAGIIDGGHKDTYTGALVGQAYRDGSVEIVKSTKAYYLGSSSDKAIGTGTLKGSADSVTAAQLKTLASNLGSAYKQGALYPILVWQDDTALDQFSAVAEYTDSSVNIETSGTVFTGCLDEDEKSVDFDIRKYSDVSGASVHLTSDSLKAMSESEDIKSFSIKTDGGTLSLDSDAIDELAAAGTDVYITIRKVTESDNGSIKAAIDAGKTVYEVSFKDTSSDVWTSGKGSAVIGVPFVRNSDKTVVAESIKDTGTSEIDSSYDSTDQIVTFAVNGSGYFALSEKAKSDSGKPGQDGSGDITASIWDGKSIDLTWFDKDKYDSENSYYIKTPAQLAGLAALVNGIYNSEIDTIAGDSSAIAANKVDSGDSSGPNGLNKSTSKYYYGDYNFAGKTVYLTSDIDMRGGNYMPIGGQYLMRKNDYDTKIDASFCGTLDGQGHNVYINCERRCTTGNYGDGQSVGLVGRLGVHDNDDESLRPEGASVKNLAVYGEISANRSVGGVVGKIGKTVDGGTIENCANFANVNGSDSKGLGGIVGAGWNGGIILNCYNAGTITSTYACPTGGISGSNEIMIVNCYNVGQITAASRDYAMAIGTNNGSAPIERIINCYYLDTSAASGAGYYTNRTSDDIEGHCEKKTSEQMKSVDFLSLLNEGTFVSDTANINNGYPVLKWQVPSSESKHIKSEQKINNNKTTSGTIETGVTVDGSNASASVKKKDMDGAIKAAGGSDEDIIIDAVRGKSGIAKSEVTIPAESVKTVAEDTNASLIIKTDIGDIKVANKDLTAVTDGSGSDITFTIEKNAYGSVKVVVKSDGKEITAEESIIGVSFKADDALMKSVADKAGSDNSNLVAASVKADNSNEIIRNSFVSKDGTVTAYVQAGNTVTVIANGKSFSDVDASAWYAKASGFAISHELFNGISDTEFAPSGSMTRGMFVTVLARLAGQEDYSANAEFTDVASDAWYAAGVAWASSKGIVSGYGDGKFGPNDEVTREQMALIMHNFTKAMGYDVSGSASLDKFSDSTSVDSWAADAMKWAVGSGVMSGNADETLNPCGTATRAQVATIMSNYVQALLGIK